MLPAWALRFLPYLLGVLVIAGLCWGIHHSAYKAGQAEREAYYKPILTAAQSLANAAQARLKSQERDSAALIETQEKHRAETESTLRVRTAAAERAYARIVQDIAGRRANSVSGTSGTSPEPADAAAVTQRLGAIAADLGAVAAGAVSDAQHYAECKSFYDAQRAIQSR
jgi:hypothetical protein